MGGRGAGLRLMGVAVVLTALSFVPFRVAGQLPSLDGYYLHALVGSESSPFTTSGAADIQRFRLMTRPLLGSVRFDVAWETTLTLRSDAVAVGRGFEGQESAAPWLDLEGTLLDRRRVSWVHGLDRLSASVPLGGGGRITVGRQTVSWATTLYFTPADPFVPFDPADPFREYRAGVDALRGVWFTGPLSELDVVVRPAPEPGGGESWTALVRGQRLFGSWELAAWGGMLHDEPAGALTANGGWGETGIRGEGSVRHSGNEEGTVLRAAVGLDRWFELLGRDLHAVVEVQHDGLGAAQASELWETARSPAAARGEISTLGRDALVLSASWEFHPLTTPNVLVLMNLRDGSALLSPGLTHSLTDEASLRLGAFIGAGPGAGAEALRSEHGATPLIGFAAFTLFF